jgi:hypothetical protein
MHDQKLMGGYLACGPEYSTSTPPPALLVQYPAFFSQKHAVARLQQAVSTLSLVERTGIFAAGEHIF